MLMLVVSFFSWWYGPGWTAQIKHLKNQLAAATDFFSIELLIGTLFSPFRQISAGRVNGPLGVIVQAWLDRIISRFIGAMVRSFMIILGLISLLSLAVLGIIRLIGWPVLPVLPLIFAVLGLLGVVPNA